MNLYYYVNGWRETRSYFMNLGNFSGNEVQRMIDGEIITKGENTFYIVFIAY